MCEHSILTKSEWGFLVNRAFCWLPFSTLLLATPGFAAEARDDARSFPVVETRPVAAAKHPRAGRLAEGGGAPIEIALAIAGRFEGSMQSVTQVNAGSESPVATRVTIVRDGLLDDSVRGEFWEVALDRTPNGKWTVRGIRQAWLCRRGENTDRFGTLLCR